MKIRWLIWWMTALLITSCASAPSPIAPSSTSTPVVEQLTALPGVSPVISVTKTPTVASVAIVTPATSPAVTARVRLPAPVYLLQDDQIVRLEPDGDRLTQITYEPQPVRDMSVAANGTLVYLTGDELVALDGAGRRVLLREQSISQPRITPDSQLVAYHLDAPRPGLIIGRDDSPDGVYLSAITGGRPRLLIADDPEPATPDVTQPAWRYQPVAWSPNGLHLLLYAVMRPALGIPGGEAVIVGHDDRVVRVFSCCEEELWSVDGNELTVAGGGPGPDVRFGLFRIDVVRGRETPVLTSSELTIPLVRAPQRLADGVIYAFVELVAVEDYSWEYPFRPRMVRVTDRGEVMPVRSERIGEPVAVLWDAQARGALVQFAEIDELIWLPADPNLPLKTTIATGIALAWVPADDLAARDCDGFTALIPQTDTARQYDSAVADVQGRLAALGFNPGPVDGLFGPATAAAVRAFRATASLPAGDTIDCAAWQTLLSRSIAP